MQKPIIKQKGAALIIFAVILALAATAFLVSQLDGSGVKIERDKKTAMALSEAKAALIGYMVKRTVVGERPGDLPCPDKKTDSNYDGTQDSSCASTRIGKFPWSNADYAGAHVDGISVDLSDGDAERLWYAVSRNLVDPTNVPINSDLLVLAPYPWLQVFDSSGNLKSNRVSAVIIAPGIVLEGQDRSTALPTAAQYLDNVVLGGITYNNAATSPTKFISNIVHDPLNPDKVVVNDQITYITVDELIPQIELRVAREVKQCLDEYAAASAGKYPWPEPVDGAPFNISSTNRWFGRMTVIPNIETGAGPDATMSPGWTPTCTALFTSAYWTEWKNLIFYQVADNFVPSGSKSCAGSTCISISGSGNSNAGSGSYRAAVIVAAKTLPPQVRAASTSASDYLENDAFSGINNDHQSAFSRSFVTYKPFGSYYAVVNDLVICLDGNNACK